MQSSDVGGVKRYAYKVSGGEYTPLHNDASIPFICLSMLFTYLCNFSIVRNALVSRATPPSWPTTGLGGGVGGGEGDYLLWTYGHFTDQSKHLSIWRKYKLATSVSFLLDAYRSLHTQCWPPHSWFLFLPICFPKRLHPCHTCGLRWLLSSWDSFLYQQLLPLPWLILEQWQIV